MMNLNIIVDYITYHNIVVQWLSCVRLFVAPWTVGHQAPLSMEFPRQEYWSGLPLPPPGDLPDPGIEPGSPALQVDSLPSEPPRNPIYHNTIVLIISHYNTMISRKNHYYHHFADY